MAGSQPPADRPLAGRVAVVAGATRGAGRGIAVALGEAGATVYVTGRSTSGHPATPGRPETIEETARMVTERGGVGIPVRVDHTVETEVEGLFARVAREQHGRLDLLVNDVWGGDALSQWGTPFWEADLHPGLLMQERAVFSHVITGRHGVPLMVRRRSGLVVEVTDGVGYGYRGELFYSLAKVAAVHLAEAMAAALRRHRVCAVALTPGFLRSEAMLDGFGVTERNWRDAVAAHPDFSASETPFFIGRAVVALACDERVLGKTGRSLATWALAREYGFADADGRRPDWGAFFEKWNAAHGRVRRTCEAVDPLRVGQDVAPYEYEHVARTLMEALVTGQGPPEVERVRQVLERCASAGVREPARVEQLADALREAAMAPEVVACRRAVAGA